MKRAKLGLRAETVRSLSSIELGRVQGADSYIKTYAPYNCQSVVADCTATVNCVSQRCWTMGDCSTVILDP